MFRRVRWWRHVIVGFFILLIGLLAGLRIIGAGDDGFFRPESFDAKQVTVSPEGRDGVRIREVVDIDFGRNERHGYQRVIPNDFGTPIDIVASSPDANADIDVTQLGFDTRIRLGSPFATINGRHRYVLEYTLPDAEISTGQLNLDIIGNDETFKTDVFTVILTGFELDDPRCDTGQYGSFGGCDLEPDGTGSYVAVIEPLDRNEGITVSGTITALVPTDDVPEPAEPPPAPSGFAPLGWVCIAIGIAVAAAVFVAFRRAGSNEVFGGGGAADAAYGELPLPGDPRTFAAEAPTARVPDSRLLELATIEFVPPRGLSPWHGTVLLSEHLGDPAVAAWFSEMIARGALDIDADGETLREGRELSGLSQVDRSLVHQLFPFGSEIELGKYDPQFSTVWRKIGEEQKRFVKDSGWWAERGPGGRGKGGMSSVAWIVLFIVIAANTLPWIFLTVGGLMQSPWLAVAMAIVVPLFVAALLYKVMLPSRTAIGSALTLRTESFRRFLAASEGRHVDWAWDQGLLREYSAWAVALGAAEAWRRAIESSNIPDPSVALAGPMLVTSGSFATTHVQPSSSGGGGGGFSGGGGGTGGGGGGGSSGSW